MFRKFSRFLPLALVLGLGLTACEDGTSPLVEGESRLSLMLTDAPGDFEAAVVTISRVTLHGDDNFVLLDEPFTVDLLDLRNEVAMLVDDFELPAGSYSQLRMVIEGGYIEVENEDGGTDVYASSPDYDGLPVGTQVDGQLHMPSMGESGLKVQLPNDMLNVNEGDVVVMIDFDVEESFGHQAGNSGKWVMHPVIRATDVTFGGHLLARLQLGDGVTLPMVDGAEVTLGDFVAVAVDANGTVREGEFVDSDADGIYEYMFKGLYPGAYALAVVGPDGLVVSFSPELPFDVNVLERETTTELITITGAEAAATVSATLALGAGVSLPVIGGHALTLGQFRAQLTPTGGEAEIVTFTDVNTDGTFEAFFGGLAAGEYTLTLLAPTGVTATFNPTIEVVFTVAAGEDAVHAFTLTAATGP